MKNKIIFNTLNIKFFSINQFKYTIILQNKLTIKIFLTIKNVKNTLNQINRYNCNRNRHFIHFYNWKIRCNKTLLFSGFYKIKNYKNKHKKIVFYKWHKLRSKYKWQKYNERTINYNNKNKKIVTVQKNIKKKIWYFQEFPYWNWIQPFFAPRFNNLFKIKDKFKKLDYLIIISWSWKINRPLSYYWFPIYPIEKLDYHKLKQQQILQSTQNSFFTFIFLFSSSVYRYQRIYSYRFINNNYMKDKKIYYKIDKHYSSGIEGLLLHWMFYFKSVKEIFFIKKFIYKLDQTFFIPFIFYSPQLSKKNDNIKNNFLEYHNQQQFIKKKNWNINFFFCRSIENKNFFFYNIKISITKKNKKQIIINFFLFFITNKIYNYFDKNFSFYYFTPKKRIYIIGNNNFPQLKHITYFKKKQHLLTNNSFFDKFTSIINWIKKNYNRTHIYFSIKQQNKFFNDFLFCTKIIHKINNKEFLLLINFIIGEQNEENTKMLFFIQNRIKSNIIKQKFCISKLTNVKIDDFYLSVKNLRDSFNKDWVFLKIISNNIKNQTPISIKNLKTARSIFKKFQFYKIIGFNFNFKSQFYTFKLNLFYSTKKIFKKPIKNKNNKSQVLFTRSTIHLKQQILNIRKKIRDERNKLEKNFAEEIKQNQLSNRNLDTYYVLYTLYDENDMKKKTFIITTNKFSNNNENILKPYFSDWIYYNKKIISIHIDFFSSSSSSEAWTFTSDWIFEDSKNKFTNFDTLPIHWITDQKSFQTKETEKIWNKFNINQFTSNYLFFPKSSFFDVKKNIIWHKNINNNKKKRWLGKKKIIRLNYTFQDTSKSIKKTDIRHFYYFYRSQNKSFENGLKNSEIWYFNNFIVEGIHSIRQLSRQPMLYLDQIRYNQHKSIGHKNIKWFWTNKIQKSSMGPTNRNFFKFTPFDKYIINKYFFKTWNFFFNVNKNTNFNYKFQIFFFYNKSSEWYDSVLTKDYNQKNKIKINWTIQHFIFFFSKFYYNRNNKLNFIDIIRYNRSKSSFLFSIKNTFCWNYNDNMTKLLKSWFFKNQSFTIKYKQQYNSKSMQNIFTQFFYIKIDIKNKKYSEKYNKKQINFFKFKNNKVIDFNELQNINVKANFRKNYKENLKKWKWENWIKKTQDKNFISSKLPIIHKHPTWINNFMKRFNIEYEGTLEKKYTSFFQIYNNFYSTKLKIRTQKQNINSIAFYFKKHTSIQLYIKWARLWDRFWKFGRDAGWKLSSIKGDKTEISNYSYTAIDSSIIECSFQKTSAIHTISWKTLKGAPRILQFYNCNKWNIFNNKLFSNILDFKTFNNSNYKTKVKNRKYLLYNQLLGKENLMYSEFINFEKNVPFPININFYILNRNKWSINYEIRYQNWLDKQNKKHFIQKILRKKLINISKKKFTILNTKWYPYKYVSKKKKKIFSIPTKFIKHRAKDVRKNKIISWWIPKNKKKNYKKIIPFGYHKKI